MAFEQSEQEKILNVIDFVNHHYGGSAEVKGTFSCEYCNKSFPEGEFRYNKGGYIPGPDLLDLHVEHANFPLHKLHTLLMFKDSDEIYEHPEILQLFHQSKDWNHFDVPQNCFNQYEKIMETSSLLQLASLESNHWYNAVHSTPDYTEEEMSQDPNKKWIMENEKAINDKPKQLKNSVKSEIDYVFQQIIGDKEVPLTYLVSKEFQSDMGDQYYKLSFIENTYNTLKAKNIFSPNQQRTSLIKSIDSYFEKVELEHKRNPSPF
ncbi:MAG: hypothetical protein ACLFQE_07760 [Thermotogota bacterium]